MATNLQFYSHLIYCCSNPKFHIPRFPCSRINPNLIAPNSIKLKLNRNRDEIFSICYDSSKPSYRIETDLLHEEIERPQFDINRAVILAGFAFEAYTTPTVSFRSFDY